MVGRRRILSPRRKKSWILRSRSKTGRSAVVKRRGTKGSRMKIGGEKGGIIGEGSGKATWANHALVAGERARY